MYLCREMADHGICATVVSSSFVKKEYERRVTLTPCLDEKLFLVEMTHLTESDSGVYACGVGHYTDRGKTQKITLNVHSGGCLGNIPSWENGGNLLIVTALCHYRVRQPSNNAVQQSSRLTPQPRTFYHRG